jgi:hypothetical protein
VWVWVWGLNFSQKKKLTTTATARPAEKHGHRQAGTVNTVFLVSEGKA